MKMFLWVIKKTAGHNPGPIVPPTTDGALLGSPELSTAILELQLDTQFSKLAIKSSLSNW